MSPLTWQNGTAGGTRLNATNLNGVEADISNAQTAANNAQSTANSANTAANNAQTSANNAQTTANGALPRWAASTAYAAGQQVVLPNGDVATPVAAFTSGASFDATKWATKALPDRGRITVASNTSAQSIRTNGVYQVWTGSDASGLGLPSANSGELRVYNIGNITHQQFVALESGGWQTYLCRYSGSAWTAWEAQRWQKSSPPNGTNIDTLTPGSYPIVGFTAANSMTPALPVIAPGDLEVFAIGTGGLRRWTTSGAPRQKWEQEKDAGAWLPWHRIDRSNKFSQVSLTRSAGSGYSETGTANHVRFPFKTGVPVESFALHQANFEERTGTIYTSVTNITGVWIGKAEIVNGEMTGNFAAAPTQVLSGWTLPTDGSAYNSPTVPKGTFQIVPGVDYIIAFGYTSDGTTYHRSYGGCWRNFYSAQASQQTPSNALTAGYFAPFNTWLEMETAYSVPRVAMVGDSHTTGNAVTWPVSEAPISRYAWQTGTMQINMGLGGSTLTEWNTATDYKWTKYQSTGADAWILALGQNDIYGTTLPTLANLQSLYYSVAAIGKGVLGQNMYVATVMPRNGSQQTAAQDSLRIQYNDWLRTLPARAMNVIDFAAAVDTGNNSSIDSRYISGDNIHLNTAGAALMGKTILPGVGQRTTV